MASKAKTMKTSGAKSNLNNGEGSKKALFICDYCQKQFLYSSALKQHVPVHTGQKDHNCHLCDFSTAHKSSLEDHIRRHLNERNFKCPEPNCGASFVSSTELKGHSSVHNINRLKRFSCSLCPFKTHLKPCLKKHMKNIHSELRPFKCPHETCEYSAKQKSNLNQHEQLHSVEKSQSQICPIENCGFHTKWASALKRHLETHLTLDKRYKCRFCEYSSHHHAHLVLHIRSHTGETPFACQLCSFETKDKSNLIRHKKRKHAD